MRVLLIGATGLAGSVCAAQLAASGCQLMLVGRNQVTLAQLKNGLIGQDHTTCVWDLEGESSGACQRIARFEPQGVVWAARLDYELARFSDLSGDPGRVAAAMARAVHSLASATLAAQRANRFGRWVFLGSLVSSIGGPGQAEYMLEKNTLSSLSRTLALEEGGHGITSNVILCGWIARQRETRFDAERLSKMNVTGRGVTPEEIAFAVTFLLNERAASITGVELPLCGGANLGWFLGRNQ